MKYDVEEGFMTYKSALSIIQNRLGLSGVATEFVTAQPLAPYITAITKYISDNILLITDLREAVLEIFRLADEGNEYIISNRTRDLVEIVGKHLLEGNDPFKVTTEIPNLPIAAVNSLDEETTEEGEGSETPIPDNPEEPKEPEEVDDPEPDSEPEEPGDSEEEGNEGEENDDEYIYNQELFVFSWATIMSTLVTALRMIHSSWLNPPVYPGCPCDCSARGETQTDWDAWKSGVWPNDEDTTLGSTASGTGTVVINNNCNCNHRQ